MDKTKKEKKLRNLFMSNMDAELIEKAEDKVEEDLGTRSMKILSQILYTKYVKGEIKI